MTSFVSANDINTTLTAAITSSQTSITVASTTGFPTIPSGSAFPLKIIHPATAGQVETIYVTAVSGTTLTVERGQEGSTAYAWAAGDAVFSTVTAAMVQFGFASCVANSYWSSGGTSASCTTGTLTAPCNGYAVVLLAGSCGYSTWEGLDATITASLSGLSTSGEGSFGEPGILCIGWLPMTTGQSSTFTGSMSSSAGYFWLGVSAFFMAVP